MLTLASKRFHTHLLIAAIVLASTLTGLLLSLNAAARQVNAGAASAPAPASLPYVPGEVLIGWEPDPPAGVVRLAQSGLVNQYAVAMLIGVLILTFWFMRK